MSSSNNIKSCSSTKVWIRPIPIRRPAQVFRGNRRGRSTLYPMTFYTLPDDVLHFTPDPSITVPQYLL
jgi:hypothetical protein